MSYPSQPASRPVSGFGQDEESCGIIDVTSMLGGGEKLAFLFNTQAHYTMDGELVEGGQLMAMYYDLPNGGDCRYSGGGADFPTGGSSSDRSCSGLPPAVCQPTAPTNAPCAGSRRRAGRQSGHTPGR
jgi:hypothetical protein